MRGFIALFVVFIVSGTGFGAMKAESGRAKFEPSAIEKDIPAGYQLKAFDFPFEMKPTRELPVSGVEIFSLTFPSPVKSPFETNNTVHAQYYKPKGDGPFPAVIVLEILAGGEELCEAVGLILAQHKIAALFVRMAYYGPRRPPERVRLLSPDIDHTIEGIRQTVLDCRCATAWLSSRPEVDKERLGIVGISLGSFISALTSSMEPRLKKVALLLGGGSLVDVYYDHPKAAPLRALNELFGGDGKRRMKQLIDPIDPITYAKMLKSHDLLMIAARRDDIVPPLAAELLWKATGQQKIVWIDTDHYGAALYLLPMMRAMLEHFEKP